MDGNTAAVGEMYMYQVDLQIFQPPCKFGV